MLSFKFTTIFITLTAFLLIGCAEEMTKEVIDITEASVPPAETSVVPDSEALVVVQG